MRPPLSNSLAQRSIPFTHNLSRNSIPFVRRLLISFSPAISFRPTHIWLPFAFILIYDCHGSQGSDYLLLTMSAALQQRGPANQLIDSYIRNSSLHGASHTHTSSRKINVFPMNVIVDMDISHISDKNSSVHRSIAIVRAKIIIIFRHTISLVVNYSALFAGDFFSCGCSHLVRRINARVERHPQKPEKGNDMTMTAHNCVAGK